MDPIFRAPAAGRARFIKKSFAAIGTDFGFILIANSFHFPLQNRLKPFQKSIPRQINFLIDFWIDFLLIWGRFWKPPWSQVDHMFLQSGDTVARQPLFCWVYVTFRFFGRPGPILAQFGLDFGGFEP